MQPLQIPFTIGVTGHRRIAASSTAKIEAAVLSLLEGVRSQAPDSPLLLLTGLAEGADRLVARFAIERFGAELVAVLPRAADDYRQDFASAESKAEFDRLLGLARLVVAPPSGTGRGPTELTDGYLWAGNFTALHSHLLIALWDGDEARGDGGTAEIVHAKLKGRYAGSNIDEPLTYDEGGAVAHVVTAREGEPAPANVGRIDWLFPDAVRIGARGGDHRHATVLHALNTLNRQLGDAGRSREEWSGGLQPSTVLALKAATDHLATQFQRRSHLSVRIMVVATVIVAISSALHGAIGGSLALLPTIVTAAALGTGFVVWAYSTWRHWGRLHTDFRALAEASRIQAAWIASGLPLSVADHYHPAQATSVAWIRRAIRTAFLLDDIRPAPTAPSPEERKRDAAAGHAWIDEQVAYFLGNHGVVQRYRRQARQFAILGVVCLAIGLVILIGNKLLDVTHIHQTVLDTALLLQVGRIALAITAAVQAYQAFMSFGDLQRSFAVSAHLFSLARDEARIAARQDDHPRLVRLIVTLGRAALVENVSWVILRRQRRMKPPSA